MFAVYKQPPNIQKTLPDWLREGSLVSLSGGRGLNASTTYTVQEIGSFTATLVGPRGGEVYLTENKNGFGIYANRVSRSSSTDHGIVRVSEA